MILTGKEDLRVIKTIESIKNAFKQLICEKPFDKITVKELCEIARINKKTFYRYYIDLYDLLSEMQLEISNEYLNLIKNYQMPDDLEEINAAFFKFSSNQNLVYEKITCSASYERIRDTMIERVTDATWLQSSAYMHLSDFDKRVILSFVNSTSLQMYRLWVDAGKQEPIESVIEKANLLMISGVQKFFESK